MYTTQIKESDTFNKLKECITINIVDYEFLPLNKMHTRFHLTEDETGLRLTKMIEIHFCELKKLRSGMEISDKDDPSLDWMRFIGAKTKGEMEMLAQKNDAIKDAFDFLQVISKDEEKRLAYEARQMWLMDQRTREEMAREEGEKIGEKNKVIEVAREMIREGDAPEKISRITKLPLTTIQELTKSFQ
jgi:predicted transposase/invertase (TIGR01784 family)